MSMCCSVRELEDDHPLVVLVREKSIKCKHMCKSEDGHLSRRRKVLLSSLG